VHGEIPVAKDISHAGRVANPPQVTNLPHKASGVFRLGAPHPNLHRLLAQVLVARFQPDRWAGLARLTKRV
jgi:hypothetical protein